MGEPLWKRSDDWVGSEIEDAFVMVNIDSGKYVALNLTATTVWDVIAAPVDQPAIERAMCEAYAVSSEDCHRSVTALLAQMQELQLASQT
jgi:molybdopterin biosynthesis enzyme